ncbi:MAG: LysM peptidoglycan-binding domain-containing protein [Tissierellia bacterium]|nr:LysM peptidoglycan-binding domain-containing protein [Tissierellia bacterium]
MKRYRIINKRRFFLFIISTFTIFFGIIFILSSSIRAHSAILCEEYKEIRVLEGDTLWGIARNYMPDKYDTRYLVHKLREFNELETAQIYPGDIIKVPILE